MRTGGKITALVRDGQPFPVGDLSAGDEVTFERTTGEVMSIVDKDGNETWKSEKAPQGKIGRIVADRRPEKAKRVTCRHCQETRRAVRDIWRRLQQTRALEALQRLQRRRKRVASWPQISPSVSGHGKYIRGASGYLDEVDEARRVTERTAEMLRSVGCTVKTFHDNTSHDQSTNLNAIVNWHNKQSRELDVSIHFNAYQTTSKPMGCECLYKTQEALASTVAKKLAAATDLPNRGAKYRSDLKFLNSTGKPAVLVETVFVDSKADETGYNDNFEEVCKGIAEALSGRSIGDVEPPDRPRPRLPPPGEELPPPTTERPVIGKGDEGAAVMSVQTRLV